MTADQVAERLRGSDGPVRIAGAGTKANWGNPIDAGDALSMTELDAIVEHNAGDLTAVVEAGVTLARLREELAEHGQMFALDPPGDAATIGGIVATGDSGPLRHRYGGPRDLVLGVTVALPDGSVAKAGGKVIKNVAGYDLSKLMTGGFGTLGVVARVALRLHPLPRETVTAYGETDDPEELARVARAASHAHFEPIALDYDWRGHQGWVYVRFGGVDAEAQAQAARDLLAEAGADANLTHADEELWREQALRQRSDDGTVVRVSHTQSQLEQLLGMTSLEGASVVGRVALGVSWFTLRHKEPADVASAVRDMRKRLAPAACVILDAPAEVRSLVDPWGIGDGPELTLMRRTKDLFDPRGVCNRGIYVAGI
ncbi:MAG: glycolate oxidase binding subunit [Thermoleophilales bacterium]|nr:glycolate oxidase binding subunit [Thermoleophilales bacterium]